MHLTYQTASASDADAIYQCCRQLILNYESPQAQKNERIFQWVQQKIRQSIHEYTVVYADGKKAGYYHFYQNTDGLFEIDDLYIFPPFQNQGIGTKIIDQCCASVDAPVMLYVFIRNRRALSLYQRLGFEIIKTIPDSRYIMQKTKKK